MASSRLERCQEREAGRGTGQQPLGEVRDVLSGEAAVEERLVWREGTREGSALRPPSSVEGTASRLCGVGRRQCRRGVP